MKKEEREPSRITLVIPWIVAGAFGVFCNVLAFFAFVAVLTVFVKFVWSSFL